MSNITLAMMQEIEVEAQAVLDSYNLEVDKLKVEAQKELEAIGQAYDQETEREVTSLKEKSIQELAVLHQEMEGTIVQNQRAVREALTDKKESLVEAIVEKVVARYGH